MIRGDKWFAGAVRLGLAYPNRGFHRARQNFLLKVDYAVGLSRFDQLETSRRTCDVPGPRPTRSKKSPISRRKRAPSSLIRHWQDLASILSENPIVAAPWI